MESTYFTETQKALDRLERALETANDRHRQMRRERKELWERVEEMQRERQKTDAGIAARDESARKDKKHIEELEESIRQMKQSLAEANSKRASATGELSLREATIKDRENTIGQLRTQVAEFRTGQEKMMLERTALEARLSQATTERDMAAGQVAPLQERIAELEARAGDISGMQAERERAERQLGELRAELEGSGALVTSLQSRLELADSDIREREAQQNGLIEELRGRIADYEHTVQKMKSRGADAAGGSLVVDEEERLAMMEQITAAISLIDEQLEKA